MQPRTHDYNTSTVKRDIEKWLALQNSSSMNEADVLCACPGVDHKPVNMLKTSRSSDSLCSQENEHGKTPQRSSRQGVDGNAAKVHGGSSRSLNPTRPPVGNRNKRFQNNELDDGASVLSQSTTKSARSISLGRGLRKLRLKKRNKNDNSDDATSVCTQSTTKSTKSTGLRGSLRRIRRSKSANAAEFNDSESGYPQSKNESSLAKSLEMISRSMSHLNANLDDDASVSSRSTVKSSRTLNLTRLPKIGRSRPKANEDDSSTSDDDSFSGDVQRKKRFFSLKKKSDRYYDYDDDYDNENFCTDMEEFCDYCAQSCHEVITYFCAGTEDSKSKRIGK